MNKRPKQKYNHILNYFWINAPPKKVLRRAAEDTALYSKVIIVRIMHMKCVEIENKIH